VVADGTAAGSSEDALRVNGVNAITPFVLAELTTVRVTSGSKPGPALEDMVKRITSPCVGQVPVLDRGPHGSDPRGGARV